MEKEDTENHANVLENWTQAARLPVEEPEGTDLLWQLWLHRLSLKQGQEQEQEDREEAALVERLGEQSLLENPDSKATPVATVPWLAFCLPLDYCRGGSRG